MRGAEAGRDVSDRVVVTGLGAVTPFGWGVDAFWSGLRAGVSTVGPFGRFDHTRHRTHVAAEVPEAPKAPDDRRSLADRFAVAAALEAWQAASAGEAAPERVGVFFGSSTGGMLESEAWFQGLIAGRHRPPTLALLVSQQYDGPGNAVARALRVRGPVLTLSSACASGAMAVAAALEALRRGEVDLAVAGGSDSLCRLTYAGFNSLRSVDERPSRPFRADRAGLSLGEGAGVLVLERGSSARARGARIRAGLGGAAATCDAHHMTAPHPRGEGAAVAIRRALASADTPPGAVDFVNAHGTGTPHNDAAETEALRAALGERASRVPVTSTKALVGHLLGSAGAVEAVATVLCLEAGEVHPMPDEGAPDPALGLDLVLGAPRALPAARVALSTSLAFGGANAALVFERAEAGRG